MSEDIKVPLINKIKNKSEKEKTKKTSKKYSEDNNIEDEEDENIELLEKEKEIDIKIILKNKMISKIYFLFFIQLSITFLFIYYAFHNQLFMDLLKKNKQLFILSIILTGFMFFSSYLLKILLITAPFNYFFFLVFTISLSYIICKIVILFSFKTIAFLWVLILIMFLSLSTYAYNSSKEIKIISGVSFSSIIVVSFSIIIKFVAKIPIVDILFILLCLTSLTIYLVYDVNSIIKEKEIGSKDYILVNILLYTDIFRIFSKIIKLITKYIESSDGDGNSLLSNLKGLNDEIEKGYNEIKNFGKKDDSDEEDDSDDDDSEDNKKGKNKGKKGKKEDKKDKGKKSDKSKKDSKGKKDKKEDKKDKGKKDKNKKEDKKDKKGKKDKGKKSKKDEDDFFNLDDPEKAGKIAGDFFANIFSK